MKNILILLFFSVMSLVTYAQEKPSAPHSYTNTKAKAKIQTEVDAFITKNWKSYKLTPAKIEEAKKSYEKALAHEQEEHGHSHGEEDSSLKLENLLNATKRNELTKLFFEENPSKKEIFDSKLKITSGKSAAKTANKLAPGVIRYADDNGDFEAGITDDYDFTKLLRTGNIHIGRFFNTYVNFVTDTPSSIINNFIPNSNSTLTNSTTDNPVFDPVLSSLANNPVFIPVVNSGLYAIRLNNENTPFTDGNVVSKLTKTFIANSEQVTYAFNFICENPIGHSETEQPRFIVRLVDKDGVTINQDDIVSDVNNTDLFKCARNCDSDALLYTGWQCASLSLGRQYDGQTITLEFSVNDCTLGGHFGYVYIDDIDVDGCDHPIYGKAEIDINPIELGNCPNLPLEVCGIIKAPRTLDNVNMVFADNEYLRLHILKNNLLIKTINQPKSLTNNGTDKDNTFCFDLNESDLDSEKQPEGDYSFYVTAGFKFKSGNVYEKTTSEKKIAFLDCARCCKEHEFVKREVRKSKMDPKQASIKLEASNLIHEEGYAIYHAGKEVYLKDGFFSQSGSKFHGYIEACTQQHQLKSASDTPSGMPCCEDIYRAKIAAENIDTTSKEIALIKIEDFERNDIIVSPNPSTGIFKISILNVVDNGQVKIFDFNGKIVFEKEFNEQNEVEIDMTHNASGIYIIQLSLDDEIITKKIIKE